jgi:hypothetical protein
MQDRPLPQELQHFSNIPDLQYRGNNEWSAACPHCGGGGIRHDKSDRFRLFATGNGQNARVWCRRCNHFEWADANKSKPPDPAKIKEAEDLRREMAQQETLRLRAKIDELRRKAYWEGWHDAMNNRQRAMWRNEGISDGLQNFFRLGYVDQRQFYNGDQPFNSPAMTIPIFDVGWKAVNVQYRIVNPPHNVGKYRFTAGLPAPLYLTDPDNEPTGPTVLVEGAKKAIVLYANVGHKFTVVAVPSKMPGASLIERLKECDPVYVTLDPDAYVAEKGIKPAINRLASMLKGRARIVKLPVKPDDLFTKFDGSANDFMNFTRQAIAT